VAITRTICGYPKIATIPYPRHWGGNAPSLKQNTYANPHGGRKRIYSQSYDKMIHKKFEVAKI
jgi:hypothetical protein